VEVGRRSEQRQYDESAQDALAFDSHGSIRNHSRKILLTWIHAGSLCSIHAHMGDEKMREIRNMNNSIHTRLTLRKLRQ
jgi:hypothetical protein